MQREPKDERGPQDRAWVRAVETNGQGGVRRLRYQNANGQTVGTARVLGITIGDLEVKPTHRRKGYGTAILRDLVARGGRSLFAVSKESRRLAEREGFILDAASGRHVLRGPPTPA